jgi:hypothetical protein
MPVSVIVRVKCDVLIAKSGSKIKRKCGNHAEFEAENIVKAKWAAEDAGWRFQTHKNPDRAICPECGPSVLSYQYGKSR